jgi:hypothetical protein
MGKKSQRIEQRIDPRLKQDWNHLARLIKQQANGLKDDLDELAGRVAEYEVERERKHGEGH